MDIGISGQPTPVTTADNVLPVAQLPTVLPFMILVWTGAFAGDGLGVTGGSGLGSGVAGKPCAVMQLLFCPSRMVATMA